MRTISRRFIHFTMLVLVLAAQSCKSAQFDADWKTDIDSWKSYTLNNVDFRIPNEFPMIKMNQKQWWFVISAKQTDSFSQGVRQAIDISSEPGKPIPADIRDTQVCRNILRTGGRVKIVEAPVKGALYFAAQSFEDKAPKTDNFDALVITGSSFGYIFVSPSGTLITVSLFKTTHTAFPYQQWHPETEIFSEKERKLVAQIASLVK